MNDVALIIIYNHHYTKNIDILEKIYSPRFRHVYHLIPFYEGDRQNVIPVYENSHFFQGYVAQGLPGYFDSKFDHYMFVADDMLINPIINEENYKQHLQIDTETCFVPSLMPLHEYRIPWPRLREAYQYRIKQVGIEIKDRLPSYEEALRRFNMHGLEVRPLSYSQIAAVQDTNHSSLIKGAAAKLKRMLRNFKHGNTNFELSYPMAGSYSDLFVVNRDSIRSFCHYCGVFAASNLHVELAIPTAMLLVAKKISTEGKLQLKGQAFWSEQDAEVLSEFDNDLKGLVDNFPSQCLYIHPIKLSKWNYW